MTVNFIRTTFIIIIIIVVVVIIITVVYILFYYVGSVYISCLADSYGSVVLDTVNGRAAAGKWRSALHLQPGREISLVYPHTSRIRSS